MSSNHSEPSLSRLRQRARDLVHRHQSHDIEIVDLLRTHHPEFSELPVEEIFSKEFQLTDAQLIIARINGHSNWQELLNLYHADHPHREDIQYVPSDIPEAEELVQSIRSSFDDLDLTDDQIIRSGMLDKAVNEKAKEQGMPPIGAVMQNCHGLEWEIVHYGLFPASPVFARSKPISEKHDAIDFLPIINPLNISQRLQDFYDEVDRCTSKFIVLTDTMPYLHPKGIGHYSHSANLSSNPECSYIYFDMAHLHESIFAHELGHFWSHFVLGADDLRTLRNRSDTGKVNLIDFIHSFILDLMVNELIDKRGFDVSVIIAQQIDGLAFNAEAFCRGYYHQTMREAVGDVPLLAAAMLDRERWPNKSQSRVNTIFEIYERCVPHIYNLAKQFVDIVNHHGYRNKDSIRLAIDECTALSFKAIGENFDPDTELRQCEVIGCMQDKRPYEFSGCTVPLKLEIGKTLARNGISGGFNVQMSANANGKAQINVERNNGDKIGPLIVDFQLVSQAVSYAQEFQRSIIEVSHHNRSFTNGRMMDQYGRLPGHPSYNSATPPEHDPFGDTFSHMQVPLPGNDPFSKNPVLYRGRRPDQYGRLPGHPQYNWPAATDQHMLNGISTDHLQVPSSELKKLSQIWRNEIVQKEMAARAALQQQSTPLFAPVNFKVNPGIPHKVNRDLPPPDPTDEETNITRCYMAGIGLSLGMSRLKYQMASNAQRPAMVNESLNDIVSALRFNLYQYANNNPVMNVDPTGLMPSIQPGCKEATAIQVAMKQACDLINLANVPPTDACAPGQNCASRSVLQCLQQKCQDNSLKIQCGSASICHNKKTAPCAQTISYNSGGCTMILCTNIVGDPKSNCGPLVDTILHEMTHCCGVTDGGLGNINPAEHIARCLLELPGDMPGY